MGRPRKYINCNLGQHELDAVLSVSEAARLVYVDPSTIRYHIKRGNINAKLFGHSYGVSLSSLQNYYFPHKESTKPPQAA